MSYICCSHCDPADHWHATMGRDVHTDACAAEADCPGGEPQGGAA